jgi:hypothetical protein
MIATSVVAISEKQQNILSKLDELSDGDKERIEEIRNIAQEKEISLSDEYFTSGSLKNIYYIVAVVVLVVIVFGLYSLKKNKSSLKSSKSSLSSKPINNGGKKKEFS